VAGVDTKYGKARLVLDASNSQEGDLLRSVYKISDVKLDLKGIDFTVPRRKINRFGEMKGVLKLEGEESTREPLQIYASSVFLGYDLEANFAFQKISIVDQDRYGGSFIFSFDLLGPGPLPNFGEKEVSGAFQATRVE